jgi:hypothetical protein
VPGVRRAIPQTQVPGMNVESNLPGIHRALENNSLIEAIELA